MFRLFLLSFVLAAAAPAATIPVQGSGSFGWDEQAGFVTAYFQGVLGNDSVYVGSSCNHPGNPTWYSAGYTWSGIAFCDFMHNSGEATVSYHSQSTTIDITSHWFSWELGGGGGSLTLYDDSTQHIISQVELQGYVTLTITASNRYETDGTLTISPTPEPATVLTGMVAVVLCVLFRKRRLLADLPPE